MSKRIAIAGTGIRALGFAKALAQAPEAEARLVALYDLNPKRMQGFCELLGRQIPGFTDLAQAIEHTQPDTLLVCTPDHTHPALIEQAVAAGLDAVTEKPMAVDREGVGRILAVERAAGRRVRVAFNMRYTPFAARIKALVQEGAIGAVRSVIADWFVDRTHGAEYFRRWHAHMSQSGGLLVHKATHHFDLLNWFVDDQPASVSAVGSLEVFGKAGSLRGERCRDCEHASTCWAAMPRDAFAVRTEIDPSWNHLQKLYFNAEDEDGYIRDRCVFRPSIDIYDTMSALIRYRRGAQVTYSMTAYSPYQGFQVVLNGTDGRLEAKTVSPATRSPDMPDTESIRVIGGTNRRNVTQRIEDMPVDRTPHAGGDDRMMRHLFSRDGDDQPDPLGQVAGTAEGAYSALIGICANESIAEGRIVEIPSLESLILSQSSHAVEPTPAHKSAAISS